MSQDNRTTRFLMGGDVAPIRAAGAGMFGDVAAMFRRAGVAFFNLELPLSARGEAIRGKAIVMRGPPADIDGIVQAGLTCVNLANNHVLDFGDAALFDTLQLLDRSRIGRFGAGRTIAEAEQSHIVERSGIRIGFLGYSTTLPVGFAATAERAGVNPIHVHTAYQPKANLLEYPGTAPQIVTWAEPADLERMCAAVAALRARVDVVIVYVHWGTSMSPYVNDFQREIATAAIDAGAHALFGGHQHVVSAIEFYKGCPIVHGAGNLLFDIEPSFFNDETRKSFLFGATIGIDGLRDCHLLPVNTGVHVPPRLLAGDDPLWKSIYVDVQKHSARFGTQLAAHGDVIEVCP